MRYTRNDPFILLVFIFLRCSIFVTVTPKSDRQQCQHTTRYDNMEKRAEEKGGSAIECFSKVSLFPMPLSLCFFFRAEIRVVVKGDLARHLGSGSKGGTEKQG